VRRAVPSLPHVCWRLALSFAVLVALAVEAAEPVAGPLTAVSSDSQTTVTYRVAVDAPSPLKETLTREVGLVRWQGYSEMTEDLLARLAREAIDETRNFAAAEGYFNATIDVRIDRNTTPISVTLDVKTGTPTRIASVRIEVTGPAVTDAPLGTEAIASIRRDWGLPEGAQFRQQAWTLAKERALNTLTGSPYAAARIVRSEAAIDPDAATADLYIELASGPEFRFGTFEITGLSKYDASLVRNFSLIEPGTPYSDVVLNRYVRRLNASGYFASVQAKIDPGTTQPENATVDIAVIEARPKRFEGGVGYSTDVQWRINASYRDVNLDGHGTQFLADGRLESRIQSGAVKFQRPPTDFHWIATYFAGAERTDIESLVTRTAAFGTRWNSIDERDERAISATYFIDEQQPAGAASTRANALYAEYEWHWRRVDDLLAPTKGYMTSLFAGVGVPGISTRTFGRVRGQYAAWLPLSKDSEINLRAEAGAVLAGSRDGIPSKLLFRTGGSTTVRGYDFESLGVRVGDAIVPGRYYAVASVDAIRWIDSFWGIGVFVDAGNAVDSLSDAHLAVGYGVGARVRTPLGPFRLDVAYGHDVHQVRVQFSVGLTF
jgi:translocation and assembly module TamA